MFQKTGLTIDGIVQIITNEQHFIDFLKDIQNDYRIQRAMGEDEGDRLLTGTRIIDDIIGRIGRLEEARQQYFQKLKEEEQRKIQEQLKK